MSVCKVAMAIGNRGALNRLVTLDKACQLLYFSLYSVQIHRIVYLQQCMLPE